MTTQTQPPPLTFWTKGISLRNAPLYFAPKEEKAEHKRLHELDAMDAFNKGAEAVRDSEATWDKKLFKALEGSNEILGARAKWNDRMRDFILHHLRNENLIGLGFEPPRRMESEPHWIPTSFWDGMVQWEKNRLTAQGIVFEEVRLITRMTYENLQTPSEQPQEPPVAPGRPSIKAYIEDAFHGLHADGQIDVSQPLKAHYPLVRHWLQAHRAEFEANDSNPPDEGIRKHFSPLFKALKQNSKQ